MNRIDMIRQIRIIIPKLNDSIYAAIFRILNNCNVKMTYTQKYILVNLDSCDESVISSIYWLIFSPLAG